MNINLGVDQLMNAYIFEEYFSKRVRELRMKKGVSAYSMSLSIGQSVNYIYNIEKGRSLPSMVVFFYICEYFGITPLEFYDSMNTTPTRMRRTVENLKRLDERQFNVVASLISELRKK